MGVCSKATTGELDYTTLTAPRDLMFQDADPGVNLYGGRCSLLLHDAMRGFMKVQSPSSGLTLHALTSSCPQSPQIRPEG